MAVVVAQLSERSLLIPEVCDSNLVVGEFLRDIYLLSTVLQVKNKEREAEIGPNLKTIKV